MVVIKESKTFHFYFDCPNDVDKYLKNEIEFITKSRVSLAKNKVKNNIKQLFLKYKNGNNIHEHGK